MTKETKKLVDAALAHLDTSDQVALLKALTYAVLAVVTEMETLRPWPE